MSLLVLGPVELWVGLVAGVVVAVAQDLLVAPHQLVAVVVVAAFEVLLP